jgi:hypothetical protein
MSFITGYCHIQSRLLIRQGQVIYKHPEGSLDDFLDAAFAALALSYPKFHKMDRLSKLGFLGGELLLKDHSLLARYDPGQMAIVLSNSHASLDTDLRYAESARAVASPSLFVYTLPNIVAGEISIRHGLKGETAFFVFPFFDAVMICDYVNSVMTSEKTQACVAGWVDVMGDHHDVFLYLAEKQGSSNALGHTAAQLQRLYPGNYGTVDGQSQNADH